MDEIRNLEEARKAVRGRMPEDGKPFPKWEARKPVVLTETDVKFGFVLVEHEVTECPRCRSRLSAGPGYQPRYCERCGQKLDFTGIEWLPERELGFVDREDSPATV